MLLLSQKTMLPWTIALVLMLLQQVDPTRSEDQMALQCFTYVGPLDKADLKPHNCTANNTLCTYKTTLQEPIHVELSCQYKQEKSCWVDTSQTPPLKVCQCEGPLCNKAIPSDCICKPGPGPRCYVCKNPANCSDNIVPKQCLHTQVCGITVNLKDPKNIKGHYCVDKSKATKACEITENGNVKVCHCDKDICNEWVPEDCDCDKELLKPKPTAKPKPTGNSAGSWGLLCTFPATVAVLVGAYPWTFF